MKTKYENVIWVYCKYCKKDTPHINGLCKYCGNFNAS